jgi:hypothetical protein
MTDDNDMARLSADLAQRCARLTVELEAARVLERELRAALAQTQRALEAERVARQARDALLQAIEMTTTDAAVRTAIQRAREEH